MALPRDGEVIIVTGASRGIGAATARLLGREGAAIVVNYARDRQSALRVVEDIEIAGGRAIAVAADVGDDSAIRYLFEETDRAFGRLTGLVNNAGIVGGQKRTYADLQFDSILAVLRVNVAGTLLCAKEAILRMATDRGGSGGAIVNVSSIGAATGSPRTFVDYAASKGAVDTLTVGLAAEVARSGIRINAVRPGMIDTDVHASAGMPDRVERFGSKMPIGRAGTADEVAEAIAWLLSDRASYITGSILDVTGGFR